MRRRADDHRMPGCETLSMDSPDGAPSPELSTRIFAIGKLVYSFTLMEHVARNLTSGFCEDTDVGLVLVADLNFSLLVSKLKVLATIPELGDTGSDLGAWAVRADIASQARNAIIHQPSGLLEGRTGSLQTVRQSTKGRKIYVPKVVQLRVVEVPEIEAVAAEISDLVMTAAPLINSLIATGHWWGPPVATTS